MRVLNGFKHMLLMLSQQLPATNANTHQRITLGARVAAEDLRHVVSLQIWKLLYNQAK